MVKNVVCPAFSSKDLKALFDLTKDSMKKDRETATFLCGTAESPKLGTICAGERCEVDIRVPKMCPNGSKPFGLFHTHPHAKPWTNENDATASSLEGMRISCVGGNDKAPWLILGGEEPAPIRNLAVRCHTAKSFEALRGIAEKAKEVSTAHEKAMRKADEVSEKMKAEGKDWKEIMNERLKQFEPVDKAKNDLSDLVFSQWGLKKEGCVFKK